LFDKFFMSIFRSAKTNTSMVPQGTCDEVFERFAYVSAQGFVICDCDGLVRYANPAAISLISPQSKKDLIGKDWFDNYPENVYARLRDQGLPEVMRTGSWKDETDIVTEEGRIVQAITSISRIAGKNGAPDTLALILVDISSRAKAEYELTMSVLQLRLANDEIKKTQEKLVKADRMASMLMLSSGIVHEINNPLSQIKSNVTLLESDKVSSAAPAAHDVKEILSDINLGINRIGKIVQSLKSFGDTSLLTTMPLFVEDSIEQAFIMSQASHKLGIAVIRNYEQTEPITANQQGLLQIFSALITNAYQSIETDGSVTFATKMVAGRTEVLISDTGRGIHPADLSSVTEPFFTTKPLPDSVGLGLTIAQDIAAKYNATFSLVSEAGKGTTVTVSFPTTKPAA